MSFGVLTQFIIRMISNINEGIETNAQHGGKASEDSQAEDGDDGYLDAPVHLQVPDDKEGRDSTGPVREYLDRCPEIAR